MRIQFENVDFQSRSGPNGFGLKLARSLTQIGHSIVGENPDVRLTFINGSNTFRPNVLRLDGIYFNSEQYWQRMNAPIKASYNFANAVIVQSEFNKRLTEKYFGVRDGIHVIHNGTDTSFIDKIPAAVLGGGIPRENVWMCASAWRPHKRLSDNLRLFLELSGKDDVLLVAGKDAQNHTGSNPNDSRVKFIGDLDWESMIACMKASSKFIHLSWLDHCPNVVVDANACGCTVYCSSSGGTREIAGKGAVVIEEEEWDMIPVILYNPPKINFSSLSINTQDFDLKIKSVCLKYKSVLFSVINL